LQTRPFTLNHTALAGDKNTATAQSVLANQSDGSASAHSTVLNSWKEIASFMGRGVRTVQRWEQHLALPVHRPKGKDRSAVLAFPEELNQWLHHTPVKCLTNVESWDGRAAELLGLARELLAHGESLAVADHQRRTDVEKTVLSLREIVSRLSTEEVAPNAPGDGIGAVAPAPGDGQSLTWTRMHHQKRA
jgi:hypothetical protein